jgi:hypothetical protein
MKTTATDEHRHNDSEKKAAGVGWSIMMDRWDSDQDNLTPLRLICMSLSVRWIRGIVYKTVKYCGLAFWQFT